MKNTLLIFALITTFSAFMFATNTANDISNSTSIVCEGEHKCDDKCEKNKDGKCAEASKESNGEQKAKSCHGEEGKKSCHGKEGKKSCHGKEGKSKSESTEETDIKS